PEARQSASQQSAVPDSANRARSRSCPCRTAAPAGSNPLASYDLRLVLARQHHDEYLIGHHQRSLGVVHVDQENPSEPPAGSDSCTNDSAILELPADRSPAKHRSPSSSARSLTVNDGEKARIDDEGNGFS